MSKIPTPHATSHLQPDPERGHFANYVSFIWRLALDATNGSLLFYTWMALLTAIALVGLNAWAVQIKEGMVVTAMTDHVSWGLYIANFTFLVGLAAGGVMMVIPAYLYHDEEMHDVTIVGELLAVAAILMCIGFVVVDLGRPDRAWHLIPGIGVFHWPLSMLTWDVLVLNGYLLLNLHICGYLLYTRFLGKRPNPKWYVPLVFLSIVWAISIHTVTAFLYCGLGGRPFWNTALLAPRFLASAFVSGPAFIVVGMLLLRKLGGVRIGDRPIQILMNIMRVTMLINLLMLGSEIFTEFYSGTSHTASAKYLFFGVHGAHGLVPWMWTSVSFGVSAAILLLRPGLIAHKTQLVIACALAFVSVWIEKGMGLIIPGFIPSTLHEVVEYTPSLVEWQIMAGIWAAGLLIYTLALKFALPVLKTPLPHTNSHQP